MSWLWLVIDNPVSLQIGECLEQKAPSVASYCTEAIQKSPLDLMGVTVPLFPKRQGEGDEHMALGQDFCPVQSLSSHPTSPGLSCSRKR